MVKHSKNQLAVADKLFEYLTILWDWHLTGLNFLLLKLFAGFNFRRILFVGNTFCLLPNISSLLNDEIFIDKAQAKNHTYRFTRQNI